MIVYRCLTSEEILGMINNKKIDYPIRYGENTFNYEKNCEYKHFFVFVQHTKKYSNSSVIGEYIIPNDIIDQYGFGFYGGVKTSRNDKLFGYYTPLPEIVVKEENLKKDYLHRVSSCIDGWMEQKILYDGSNNTYNEPTEKYFRGIPDWIGYTDYSYSDIYYEMVYQLAKKNNMNLYKVVKLLENVDLHTEIKNYYEENKKFFYKQTKKYVKKHK